MAADGRSRTAASLVALAAAAVVAATPAVVAATPVAAAAPAAADPTAPAETRFRRDGFAIGIAVGPAAFYGGRDLDDVGGVGSAVALRVATVATDALLWVLELDVGSYAVRVVDRADPDARTTEIPTHSVVTLGGQLYLREALWTSAGLGFAAFIRQTADGMRLEDTRQGGVALTCAIGLDVYRRGPVALDLRLGLHMSRYPVGPLAHGALSLGATWY